MVRLLIVSFLLSTVNAIHKDLTDANFDKVLEGKNALLLFLAPW